MMADDGMESYSPELKMGGNDDDMDSPAPAGRKYKYLRQWMDITLTEPEKRIGTSMKLQETFIVYLVETRVKDPTMKFIGEPTCALWRRYSEFELLRNYLDIMYPSIIVPPLPEKRMSYAWQNVSSDKFDPDYIERRRSGLENYLVRIAMHPTLSKDEMFMAFLRQEEGWKESLYATDYYSKADSRLKAISASYRIRKADRTFDELKNYANDLQTNTSNVLRIRAKMADSLYGIHKVHANYGRVFSEWSGIEKEMGDGLQRAGHYMDVFSSAIDGILEDEEQFADQIKEYYAYGDALRTVCRKQELIQLKLEKAEDALSYKNTQREQVSTGKHGFSFSGMKSRIFGGDTPEVREQKLQKIEEEIDECEKQLKLVNEEAQLFTELALADIERFRKQKVKDIKESCTNYAVMQVEKCKKSIQIWQNARECFLKM
ncbi:sorting nexin-4-like isoform X2 [Lineus longissimus]|uniref:sorting nexin-4-like isoform X2 n=1 Tax=Lineus longissimus TaxID=88925 RepID=UPI002B4EB3C8